MTAGHDEEAYYMVSKMQFTQVQEPEQLGHGKSLIMAMVQCERVSDVHLLNNNIIESLFKVVAW